MKPPEGGTSGLQSLRKSLRRQGNTAGFYEKATLEFCEEGKDVSAALLNVHIGFLL